MRILAAGSSARLVEVGDLTEMLALYRGLDSARHGRSGIVDLVPGARTVLVEFDPDEVTGHEVDDLIWTTPLDHANRDSGGLVEVSVSYDGADLGAVCDLVGRDRDSFVSWHTSLEWTVAFTGFAPGFGYLVRPDHQFSIPRLTSPRTRVPAGAVAMADVFTGLYPGASPGGWQIIGATDHVLFDVDREPAAALLPGHRVRFVEAR